ncbi:protein translocase subunit SecD [Candidatus Daviesbacteria bacterium]|nr:protein translocase subunit SecD [Candidatus Daviesbacteria bacterium]
MNRSRLSLWSIIFLTLIAIFVNLPFIPSNIEIKLKQINLPFNRSIPEVEFNPTKLTNLFPLKLGLDLQGGTQLVLQTNMEKITREAKDDALESARQVIERRVNLFGVSEAIVQSSKLGNERRILVDLPGIKDASSAASLVGKTAQLEFREVPASQSAEATQSAFLAIYSAVPTGLTGADLSKAQVVFGQSATALAGAEVSIQFTSSGAKKFADLTKRNIGKQIPIFLDGEVISSPVVQTEILDGNALITGDFSTDEAKNLVVQLNAGALPVPIKIIEQRSIGASLGLESINKSIIAGVVGFAIVMIYMIAYYGFWGLIADCALVIYTLIVLTIFKTGLFILPPVTLTLAGIAGFILSIGMAVDANILIFERMKEERRWGKSPSLALELGFKRAWSSIRDSNISSLITALVLYIFGSGLVRGFAVTLAIGVAISMFTAIIVTRTILRLFFNRLS